MAAPERLFPDPLPRAVRIRDLREQTRANLRRKVAHNRKPQTVSVAQMRGRARRRQWRAERKRWALDWNEWLA